MKQSNKKYQLSYLGLFSNHVRKIITLNGVQMIDFNELFLVRGQVRYLGVARGLKNSLFYWFSYKTGLVHILTSETILYIQLQ